MKYAKAAVKILFAVGMMWFLVYVANTGKSSGFGTPATPVAHSDTVTIHDTIPRKPIIQYLPGKMVEVIPDSIKRFIDSIRAKKDTATMVQKMYPFEATYKDPLISIRAVAYPTTQSILFDSIKQSYIADKVVIHDSIPYPVPARLSWYNEPEKIAAITITVIVLIERIFGRK